MVDFRRRFLSLLSFKFREFGSVTALSILEAANAGVKKGGESDTSPDSRGRHWSVPPAHSSSSPAPVTSSELSFLVTPFDLKRLDSYANNIVDYHVILDLLPCVSSLYFDKRLGDDVSLSAVQASILLGMGLQRKSIEEVEVRAIVKLSQP